MFRLRLKRRISCLFASIADFLFLLFMEVGIFNWLLLPVILILAIFVFYPWTLIIGQPYRDRLVRALGRKKTWEAIREREERRIQLAWEEN